MEAGPTLETRAHTPLAVASMRVRGLLRNPRTWRALVIGGLAVAGWLLGAGSASAATPSAGGNPVGERLGQVGESVQHTGSGTAHRAIGVLHRPRAGADDATAADAPVRQKTETAGDLVHTGRDAAGHTADRATAPLRHAPVARAAHDHIDRIGHVDTPVRHAARLVDHAGTEPRRSATAGTHEIHRVAAPMTSLLGGDANENGAPLPVGGALHDPSSLTGSVTHDVPSNCAPTLAAALRDGGVRVCHPPDASPSGAPATYRADDRERLADGPATDPRPVLGRPGPPRPMCAQTAASCGHGTHTPALPVPAAPAPAGPGSGSYGMVPPPASGPILPGTGDLAWTHFDHPPHDTAAAPARRGVLPPVVRTAADEPALSPD